MSEENIFSGGKRQLPTSQVNTGVELLEALKKRDKNFIIFEDVETGETITVGELIENACQLSKRLTDFIGKSGNIIAVASENNVNYFTVVLAALFSGVPVALLDPNYTIYELRTILSITKPALVFCSLKQIPKYTKVLVTYRSIRKLVVIDSKDDGKQFDSLRTFTERSTTISNFTIKDVNIKKETAFILFSSGTTGLPKGVMLSHFSINTTMVMAGDPTIKSPTKADITLGLLPIYHVYGLFVVIMSILEDRKVVLLKKFEPQLFLKTIQNYKITRLAVVPPLVQFLLNNPLIEKYDLSSLQEIGSGASMLPEKSRTEAIKKFNLKYFRVGYGLTESGLSVSSMPYNTPRPGSVGKLYPGISAVIKDLRTGKNLPPYSQGEICIKADSVMQGYYGNPQATKNSFTKDGWLKTGDLGYFDEDGYLYIVDRLKEVIKYKGFQIAPAELEAILLTHPKIQDAGVVGKPDDKAGELPTAFVIKKSGAKLTENEVKFYVAGFVKREKHLHGGVIFLDELPRMSSGKLKRKDLKALLNNPKSKL
ncbi:luciferin 4-monooxygenase-like [Onthophagus taurus]|uniref:luciferin 4-monooxygenase-like n=1 Tax=Onthophagus taurus TaxID=166361 RepID=UPI0039BE5B42